MNFFLFIAFVAILPVIAELVLSQHRKRKQLATSEKTGDENAENQDDITRIFLSDLVLLLNHNKDNRR